MFTSFRNVTTTWGMELVWSDNSFANEDEASSPVQTVQEQENYLHRSRGIDEQGPCATRNSSTGVF